ncbi:MAG: tetratricopeptide repeat protein [Chitinophagaceae bacterium]
MLKNLGITLVSNLLLCSIAFSQADSAIVYHQKGLDEKQARRFREAEKNFNKALGFAPQKSETLIELGNVLVEQNRYMEAREQFLKAEPLSANNPVVIENLATLSYNTRKWADAIKYAQKAQQMNIGKSFQFVIAKSYYEQENYGESLKYCELAFKDEPRRAEIPYIAGRCFLEMSNYKRAAGCYEQAIERDSSKVNWMFEAGMVFYSIPDDKKAVEWFERAGAKGYPRNNEYLENLGNAYLNLKDYNKAMPLLQEALQRKPSDIELLYNVADAYYRCGKYQEAIDTWDKILVVDKKNADALYMIGLAYQKKGDKEKGIQLCEKAIEMDPALKEKKQEKKMPGGF